jgi:antitoxin FitA
MANLTIKNLPSDLYEQLKVNATQHRRSLNSEVIVCLERALRSTKIDPEAFLTRARAFRRKTSRLVLTDQALAKAKNEGRP